MANTSSYAMSDTYYQPPGTMPPMVQPFDPTASKPLMLLTVSSSGENRQGALRLEFALEGSRLAEEALRQSIQRQQLGTVRPFEIVQTQEIYIRARLDYLKAVASYNKAQYAWFVSAGNNL